MIQKSKLFLLGLFSLVNFTTLLAQEPTKIDNDYAQLILQSFDWLEKDSLPQAEIALKEAMHLKPAHPNNYALLGNLGTIQQRQHKYEEALLSFSAALNLQPKNITLLLNRALLYAQMGKSQEAFNDYHTLLSFEPKQQEALYQRGLLYLLEKNYIAAEKDFNEIFTLNDKSINARLGYALLEKTRGNYSKSERIYNYLIEQMPHNYKLFQDRGELYFMMGKNRRALADINKVFNEGKPTAESYILRGKIKLALYEKERAMLDFRKAIELGCDTIQVNQLLKLAK